MAAIVAVVALSVGVSLAQHYPPCSPDIQCETGHKINHLYGLLQLYA